MKFPVAIVGGGPAGASAAIELSRRGVACCVIEPGGRAKAGECLEPRAVPWLARLGLGTATHRAFSGIRFAHRDATFERDFVREPFGDGLVLDREGFERELEAAARAAGAIWLTGRLASVPKAGPPFTLAVATAGGETRVHARLVLDASGRAAAFVRRLGVRHARLVGAVARHAIHAGRLEDPRLLIEPDVGGYWYSAGAHDHFVVSYQSCDGRGPTPKPPEATSRRLADATLVRTTRFDAGASRATRVHGPGWLALGDAAFAHEPLSGHGLVAAIASGVDAAARAHETLGGDDVAFARHAAARERAFDRYVVLQRADAAGAHAERGPRYHAAGAP